MIHVKGYIHKKKEFYDKPLRRWTGWHTALLTALCAVFCAFVAVPLLATGAARDADDGSQDVYFVTPAPGQQWPLTPVGPPDAGGAEDVDGADDPAQTPAPDSLPASGSGVVTLSSGNGMQLEQQFEYFARRQVEVAPGDRAPEVEYIQARLMALEYMGSDEPTALLGPATQAALSRFQRINGLAQTGAADAETLALLFSLDARAYSLRREDNGVDVETLQERLAELGYYEGYLNGYFGAATERALQSFQLRNKLEPTGVMDQQTYDILYSPKARPKIDPTPTPSPKPTRTPKPATTPKPGTTSTPKPGGTATPSPVDPGHTSDPVIPGGGAEALVSVALKYVDTPYVYSEETPEKGFDCSGLVHYSLKTVGVSVGRLSAHGFSQVSQWALVERYDDLRRGDLVFFLKEGSATAIGHTGIYLGNGSFVHASSSRGKVVVSTWSTWCRTYFTHGRRVF